MQELAPLALENLPSAQAAQVALPSVADDVPGAQFVQAVAPPFE